ncbi:MAG: DUF4129 domain-containing protein [Clostridiales bacterium]|jgi:hypothetical protein|nr:DUF4129 domain-containing protein [Clostridiales bacterium]
MDLSFLFKTVCDLCLWYCAAGFALASRLPGPAYIPALITALCAALCAPLRNKKLPLRLAPLAGLAFIAVWVRSWAAAVLVIPPCAYVVFVCATGRFEPDHSQFSGYYKTASILLIFFSLFLSATRMDAHLREYYMPFMFCFLLVGLMLLRMLRMSKDARRERTFILFNASLLAVVCAAAALIGSRTFLRAVGAVIKAFASNVLGPVILAFVYAFGGILWLIGRLLSAVGFDGLSQEMQLDMSAMEKIEDIAEQSGELSPASRIITAFLVILGIAALIAIIVLVARKIAGERGGSPETRPKFAVRAEAAAPPARTELPRLGARAQVRAVYRKFLKRLDSAGVRVELSDTSLTVERKAGQLFDSAALRGLRQVYIRARYDPVSPVTKDDVREAKEHAARLRGGKDELPVGE